MLRGAIALGMATLALSTAGCGKWSQALSVSPNAAVGMKVKAASAGASAANSPEEAAFWAAYPATATFLTVKSRGLDYLVASFSARVLGFNRAPALTFPLIVQRQVQFSSCLFLGKDRKVYLSELGTGHANPRFYKVGQVSGTSVGQVLTLGQNDPLKLRLDPGYAFEPVVGAPATPGGPAGFEMRLILRSMPTVVAEPQLFTRSAAGAPASTSEAPAAGQGLSAYFAKAGAKAVVR